MVPVRAHVSGKKQRELRGKGSAQLVGLPYIRRIFPFESPQVNEITLVLGRLVAIIAVGLRDRMDGPALM